MAPEPQKKRPCILFVGINSRGMPELSVGEECEKVSSAFMVRHGQDWWRDHVSIHNVDPSKKDTDLVNMILKYHPDIVHIASHGKHDALNLECDNFVENELIGR